MQMVPFNIVFQVNEDHSLTTLVTIRVNGITVSAGVKLFPNQAVGTIDFTNYVGRQLQVEIENGVYVIKGIYA